MKKILFAAIALITLVSCEKKCDEGKITEDYQRALQGAGNSSAAVQELTKEYYKRLAECD